MIRLRMYYREPATRFSIWHDRNLAKIFKGRGVFKHPGRPTAHVLRFRHFHTGYCMCRWCYVRPAWIDAGQWPGLCSLCTLRLNRGAARIGEFDDIPF